VFTEGRPSPRWSKGSKLSPDGYKKGFRGAARSKRDGLHGREACAADATPLSTSSCKLCVNDDVACARGSPKICPFLIKIGSSVKRWKASASVHVAQNRAFDVTPKLRCSALCGYIESSLLEHSVCSLQDGRFPRLP